jgi:cellulose synthase/poly-beta-1,6-N-acetylglucosamine synthase-like glycosyltransferase
MTELIFWSSIAVLMYTYVAFPIVTWIRSRLCHRPWINGDGTPSVSLLIAAHNEEDSIGEKVRNMLALDYPAERLQLVVVSDGSTDRTVDTLRTFSDSRLVVLDLPRGGKANALNRGEEHCTGEILVFSDANSMFPAGALRAIVRPFADPTVGGVAGDQRYSKDCNHSAADAGERTYWNFDRLMKSWQSRAGSVTSATGAIYAVRRSLFRMVPEGVTDDFVTSTGVIAQGFRLVFAPEAVAYEPVAASTGIEFGRKVRIITRGLRGVLQMRSLLNPFRFGFYSVQLFSHKLLRRQMVFPLLSLLATSVMLAGTSPLFLLAAVAQITFYGAAGLGCLLHVTAVGRLKPFSIPFYFCLVNSACLIATLHSLAGRRVVLWNPQRGGKSAENSLTALVKG